MATNKELLETNNDELEKNNEDLSNLLQEFNNLPESIKSYLQLLNKPSINNVILENNKTLKELGIQPIGNYETRALTNLEIDEIIK